MIDFARKEATVYGAWVDTYLARLWSYIGPPDADRDKWSERCVVTTPAGDRVPVSLGDHGLMTGAESKPAGWAVLERRGQAQYAIIEPTDSDAGRALRARLDARGEAQQWSVGYRVIRSHVPTAREREEWPDCERVIDEVLIVEISPVTHGACGPSCRTIPGGKSAKCAGRCGCAGGQDVAVAARQEWARFVQMSARIAAQPDMAPAKAAKVVTLEAHEAPLHPELEKAAREGVVTVKLLLAPMAASPRVRFFGASGVKAANVAGLCHYAGSEVWIGVDTGEKSRAFEIGVHEALHYFAPHLPEDDVARLGRQLKALYREPDTAPTLSEAKRILEHLIPSTR